MKLGILGGTFDPVHRGHLDVAEAARHAVGLDRIMIVPSRVPSHRGTPHASAAHRFAMAALAAQPFPHLLVSDIEMEHAEPAYTVNTLDRLVDQGADATRLFFITGADAFLDIRSWKDFPAVLDRSHFVVVSRPGHPAGHLQALLPDVAGRMKQTPCEVPDRPTVLLVDAPTAAVSATGIRDQVGADAPIDDFVPAAVADYIRKHRLYSRTPEGIA